MVNKVVPTDQVMDETKALAQRIITNAPLAVQGSLRVAKKAFADSDEDLFMQGGVEFAKLMQTEDFKEGPKAFIEKRAPQWKGK